MLHIIKNGKSKSWSKVSYLLENCVYSEGSKLYNYNIW